MTNVTMKAIDTLHLSSVQADSLRPDEEFTVSAAYADDLEKRGLATRIGDAPEAPPEAAPVENEALPPVSAKSVRKAKA